MLRLKRKKGSPYWYVRGTVAGQYIECSTKTTDRKLAEPFRARLENSTYNEAALDKRQPATWAEAVSVYLDNGGEERFILPVLEAFAGRTINEIGQEEIDKAARKAYPKASPATLVRQFYTPTIAILRRAARARLDGATNPKVEKPSIRHNAVRWATDAYLATLLRHCTPKLVAVILVMTYTGLRVGEVVRLRRSAFTAIPGYVICGKTKSGKPRKAILNEATRNAVQAVLAKDEFSPALGLRSRDSVRAGLKWACKKAGLEYLSPHKIGRHAFAARMLAKGNSLETVRQAGGWASLQVLSDNYGHLEQSHVEEAMLAAAERKTG